MHWKVGILKITFTLLRTYNTLELIDNGFPSFHGTYPLIFLFNSEKFLCAELPFLPHFAVVFSKISHLLSLQVMILENRITGWTKVLLSSHIILQHPFLKLVVSDIYMS